MQALRLVFPAMEDVSLGVRASRAGAHGVQVGESLSLTVRHRCCTGYGRFDRF
jgi:hypothetical protein